MQLGSIQRILGLLLMMFSLTMLPPIGIAWIYEEPSAPPFIVSMLLVAGAGAALWFPVRRLRGDLRLRDGFVIVVAFWFALGITGSVPLLLSDNPDLPLADAVFESVSGLTTTGATVITGLDALPKAGALLPPPSCSGSEAWGSSCSRSPFSRCSASAGCSSTARRHRGR